MKYCEIKIAFGNLKEVNAVINELLKQKLASGCQVIESQSKWCFENKIEMCKEYLLFIKTTKNLVNEIYQVVRKIHSYKCFEFSIFDFQSSSKDYLDWIEDTTR